MNLMRGPKEEVVEEVVEEEEKFGVLKPLAAPPAADEASTPALPAPPGKDDNGKHDGTPSSGEESGEATAEEGETPKEEQITLQDLLG